MATIRSAALGFFLITLTSLGAAPSVPACALHGGDRPLWEHAKTTPADKNDGRWVDPSMSGSWYSTDRSGEGFVLQILPDGQAIAVWFTYPPAGSPGQQAWVFAQDARIDGDQLSFNAVYTTRGPRFGTAFDPSRLERIAWGNLSFRYTGCDRAELSYAGPAAWGSGNRVLARLTAIDELTCNGKQKLNVSGSRALGGLRQRSGAWFDPSRSGEGWMVEELPDQRRLVYWFTYDEQGEQAWMVGVAEAGANQISINDLLRPVGTRFGSGFNAADVRRERWGSLSLDLASCNSGSAQYQASSPAFGQGQLQARRLTALAGAICHDQAPTGIQQGQWSVLPRMPQRVSEVATAAANGQAYIAGGFGGARTLQRFDAATQAWTRLADLPGGRDHALAVPLGADILLTGGYPNQQGNQSSIGWRYLAAENRWVDEPSLPLTAAAGAALLNGFAWFADMDGRLHQYDPRTRRLRVIDNGPATPRDHSQLVAFQGELWMLGGRAEGVGENFRVAIYDPASDGWRQGPPMLFPRGGFAAAADSERIIVAGGEIIFSGSRTLDRAETISAGEAQWVNLPSMSVPVHGVGGFIHNRRFHALGGSLSAGTANNDGTVQVYSW